ncbi:unnamed protein product (macronuclear) [Paramecium tetraurelia]|uniref:Uncharacterized protein n=1 Tax=Paramecium tetraurelia TaxID=5888 RepID=A0E8G7_PARTE|nr:uncharacterized protein GSPATT00024313001 [Paramecium tetraurelia]CAK91584.1 unnamed protein product [Paramecium tetraurelia]|eukprot:XP_001458981.1 hypothetical protein (macronuclear) [Paramecium tetraurelia strain d4-2]
MEFQLYYNEHSMETDYKVNTQDLFDIYLCNNSKIRKDQGLILFKSQKDNTNIFQKFGLIKINLLKSKMNTQGINLKGESSNTIIIRQPTIYQDNIYLSNKCCVFD